MKHVQCSVSCPPSKQKVGVKKFAKLYPTFKTVAPPLHTMASRTRSVYRMYNWNTPRHTLQCWMITERALNDKLFNSTTSQWFNISALAYPSSGALLLLQSARRHFKRHLFTARHLSPVSTTRVDGWPVSITRQYGPSTRVVKTGLYWQLLWQPRHGCTSRLHESWSYELKVIAALYTGGRCPMDSTPKSFIIDRSVSHQWQTTCNFPTTRNTYTIYTWCVHNVYFVYT